MKNLNFSRHFMLRNKAAGVISAVQHENGEIEWNKELPKTCLLSLGLKRLITPLIAGLLESRQEKVYSFNQYFQEVANITACQPFHLFDGQHCCKITLYTKTTDKMIDLLHDIAATTGIAIQDQLLFTYNNQKIDRKTSVRIHDLKDFSEETRPVLLISRSSTEIGITKLSDISSSTWSQPPISKFPVFDMNTPSLDHDAFKAKNFTSLAFTLKRHILLMLKCYHHLCQLPKALSTMIEDELTALTQSASNILQTFSKTDETLKIIAKHYSAFMDLTMTYSKGNTNHLNLVKVKTILQDKERERETVSLLLQTLQSRAASLEQKFLLKQKGQLYKQWEEQVNQNIGSDHLYGCQEEACTFVKDIRDSWKALAKFRELRRLSFHDEQFHQLEKIKLKRTGDKLMALWQKTSSTLRQANKELNRWYSVANAGLVQVSCLSNEIRQVQKTHTEYDQSLAFTENECSELLQQTLKQVKYAAENPSSLNSDKDNKTPNSSILPTHQIGDFTPDKTNSLVADGLSKNANQGDSLTEPKKKSTSSMMLKGLQELKETNGSLWSEVQANNSMMNELQALTAQLNFLEIENGFVGNFSLNQDGN